jgi:hypothetical protein
MLRAGTLQPLTSGTALVADGGARGGSASPPHEVEDRTKGEGDGVVGVAGHRDARGVGPAAAAACALVRLVRLVRLWGGRLGRRRLLRLPMPSAARARATLRVSTPTDFQREEHAENEWSSFVICGDGSRRTAAHGLPLDALLQGQRARARAPNPSSNTTLAPKVKQEPKYMAPLNS